MLYHVARLSSHTVANTAKFACSTQSEHGRNVFCVFVDEWNQAVHASVNLNPPDAEALFSSPGFSERELLHAIARPSVVCLSVTFVRPTQPVEIFKNVSSPFGTVPWPSVDIHGKFCGDRLRGTPPARGLNARGVVKQFSTYRVTAISRKLCKIGGKLALISNRKSYTRFQMVPKSVTLNDLERRNGPYFALFHRIRVYNVDVKQLPQFQRLLLRSMTVLIRSAQLFSDYLGKTNSDNSARWA